MTIQLENENALRNYPLAENVTTVSDDGSSFPYSLITGLNISSYVELEDTRISSIYEGPGLVSVVISDSAGVVATATSTESGTVRLSSMRDGVFGSVTFYMSDAVTQPRRYRFSTPEQSAISSFCILVFPFGGVKKFEDQSSGEEATGDVKFDFAGKVKSTCSELDNGGMNVDLSLLPAAVKAVDGNCIPMSLSEACISPVIRSINGLEPNENGEIAIIFE